MRLTHPVPSHRGRHTRTSVVLGLTLLGALSVLGCSNDEAMTSAPITNARNLQAAGSTIVVGSAAELAAALVPENAGQRILVRAGTYAIDALLTVPDGVTLEGEGIMQFDGTGLPVGFGAGARSTLVMTGNAPGDMLTLGNGVTIRALQIEDRPGRLGNVIGVVSRDAGDRVSATIAESEIVNPNPLGSGPDGSTGYGLFVSTRNPNLGAAPAPHEGAAITARMVNSLVSSPAGGGSLFAFNFAALGNISVTLTGNVLGGEVTASGGVNRPDAVHDATVSIESRRNLYRGDVADPCSQQRSVGWNLTGGSTPPAPLPVGETARNSLLVHSVDDRIERYASGVVAAGSRRFFAASGPTTDNSLDLELLGTRISTPECGGAGADIALIGADAPFSNDLAPGNGNTLRALIRGVTGSGSRANRYGNAMGLSGPLSAALEGTGNLLTIVGNPNAFVQTNRQLDPLPGAEFFTGVTP